MYCKIQSPMRWWVPSKAILSNGVFLVGEVGYENHRMPACHWNPIVLCPRISYGWMPRGKSLWEYEDGLRRPIPLSNGCGYRSIGNFKSSTQWPSRSNKDATVKGRVGKSDLSPSWIFKPKPYSRRWPGKNNRAGDLGTRIADLIGKNLLFLLGIQTFSNRDTSEPA